MLIGRASAPGRCYIDACLHRGQSLTLTTLTTSPQPTHLTSGLAANSQKMVRYNDPAVLLAYRACETDDTTLLKEAFRQQEISSIRPYYGGQDISEAQELEMKLFTDHILFKAINSNATPILSHLIESGVSMEKLSGLHLATAGRGASQSTLEFLLARGWDINYRVKCVHFSREENWGRDTKPYMWWIVKDHALVKWCLEHGASVHPRDYQLHKQGRPTQDQFRCEPILELAACHASVATFELLRARGAPLGWRTLHLAVEWACHDWPDSKSKKTDIEKEGE